MLPICLKSENLCSHKNLDRYDESKIASISSIDEFIDAKEQITKQYETAKKAGLIGEDVTYDQYKAGVEDGTYKVATDTFDQYNKEQRRFRAVLTPNE